MSGLAKYYCIVLVLFLALAAYNLIFYVTYKADICYTTDVSTSDNSTDSSTTSDGERILSEYENQEFDREIEINYYYNNSRVLQTSSTKKVQSSIHLTTLPIIFTIVYAGIIFFISLGICGIRCFSKMAPERFGNLGWCWSCIGCFVRNFNRLIRIFHFILLLLIFIQFAIIFAVPDCQTAAHITPDNAATGGVVGEMQDASVLVNIVSFLAWILLHYILPCFKQCLDSEAYLYEPFDKDQSIIRYFLCNFFGP